MSRLLRKFLTYLFPGRLVFGRHGLYFTRWIVRENTLRPHTWGCYIHRFSSPDQDPRPHNHPWAWMFSIVLWGWYDEERSTPTRGSSLTRRVRWFNLIRKRGGRNLFHRIDRIAPRGCWTLVFIGPRVPAWGYLDLFDWTYVPHEAAHPQVGAYDIQFRPGSSYVPVAD